MNFLAPFTRFGIIPQNRPASFPSLNAIQIHDASVASSVLNSSGTPAAFYEQIQTIQDLSGNNHHLTQTTPSIQSRYIKKETDNFLFINSTTTNPTSLPYYAALNIPGSFVFDIDAALFDWNTGAHQFLAGPKATGQGFAVGVVAGGFLYMEWSAPGFGGAQSSVANTLADHQRANLRFEYIANTGAGQWSVRFLISTDGGVNYTQLGTTQVGATNTGIIAPTSGFQIGGAYTSIYPAPPGRIFRARLWSGSTSGTLVMDWNANNSEHFASSGTFAVGTGTVLYNHPAVLIANSVILTPSGGSQYDIAIPYGQPLDHKSGISCYKYSSGVFATAHGPVTDPSASVANYMDGSLIFGSRQGRLAYGTSGSPVSGKQVHLNEFIGTNLSIYQNGSSRPITDQGAYAGSNYTIFGKASAGPITPTLWGRFGHWQGASTPTVPECTAWLNYTP